MKVVIFICGLALGAVGAFVCLLPGDHDNRSKIANIIMAGGADQSNEGELQSFRYEHTKIHHRGFTALEGNVQTH
jgi:hypothetical protein